MSQMQPSRPSGGQRRRPGAPRGLSSGWTVARFAGVPLVVSPFWVAIAALFTVAFEPTVTSAVPGLTTTTAYVVAAGFVLLVYAAVLLHEVSHVAVARGLGLPVGRIVLQPLGGMSEILRNPETAGSEFLVAAAGPLTSVLLGGVGIALSDNLREHSIAWLLASAFGFTNLVVAAFNLLPGMPLDGGRLLRAGVWQVTGDKSRALIISGYVGVGIAVCMALFALSGGTVTFPIGRINAFYLVFLSYFVGFSAMQAVNQGKLGVVLPRLHVGPLVRPALPVEAQLPLAEGIRRARASGARALVVVDGTGRPTGLVSEARVVATPPERQPWMSVSDVARPMEPGLVVEPDLSGEALLDRLRDVPATEYLVVDRTGGVRGVLASVDIWPALRAAGLR